MTFLPVFQVDDVKKKLLWLANGHTVTVWLWNILIPKIKWSRHHSASFFAVKCRKNGYFHTFLGRYCFKTAVIGGKGSNTNGLALEHTLAKNWMEPSSFSVIFCRKMLYKWLLLYFFAVKCCKNGYFHTFLGC